jgi:hypothetical protein
VAAEEAAPEAQVLASVALRGVVLLSRCCGCVYFEYLLTIFINGIFGL